MSGIQQVTFWGFDGSSLSHGSGFVVLFKLNQMNENVTLSLSISYMPDDRSLIKWNLNFKHDCSAVQFNLLTKWDKIFNNTHITSGLVSRK